VADCGHYLHSRLNFDRLTVKHALKMIATSGFLPTLDCTKFVSAGVIHTGELTALPRPRPSS